MFLEIQNNGFSGKILEDSLGRFFLSFQWSETIKLIQNHQIAPFNHLQTFHATPEVFKMFFQFENNGFLPTTFLESLDCSDNEIDTKTYFFCYCDISRPVCFSLARNTQFLGVNQTNLNVFLHRLFCT